MRKGLNCRTWNRVAAAEAVPMSKGTTRDGLLDAGERVFLERGYHHAGIEMILQSAGVPKGSFYYYFDNKEDFGLQVLNRFAACHKAELDRYLKDTTRTPVQRLRRLAESLAACLESRQCRKGCLVGNMSQELADQCEMFRARLGEIFEDWVDSYTECIREAQGLGEISEEFDARALAEFWLAAWQGTVLRAKTMRSSEPLKTFANLMFGFVIKK